MRNLNQVQKFVDEKLDDWGVPRVPVELNGRMKRSLGRVRWINWYGQDPEVRVMQLSTDFFRNANDEEFSNTVLHEIAHVIEINLYGRGGHGQQWREIAEAIGARPEETVKTLSYETHKWAVHCTKCGKLATKKLKYPTRLLRNKISGCCRAELEARRI